MNTREINMDGVGHIALTAADLRRIADGLDKLAATGVRIPLFYVGEHRIDLEWHDQRDGSWYTVTAITRSVDNPVDRETIRT